MTMERATPRIDPEELLANAKWLHALARSLVGDGDRADDVVQQTLVAAVEHEPDAGVPLRPWLARVARNFSLKVLRSEGRRARHEGRAPALSPPASPAESVARAEMFRVVVDAVLALEPIHRDAVIARFFDGLEMTAVAERLGVPVETARTRLKRALAILRDRLDRKYGDRRAWALLLLGRRAAPVGAGIGGGMVAMKVVAAVAVALVGGWYALRTDDSPGAAPSREVAAVAVGTTAASSGQRHPASRVRAATTPGEASASSGGGKSAGATLVVHVTDADTHRPIAGATVELANPVERATTDADGVVRFERGWAQRWIVTAEAPAHLYQLAAADEDATTIDLVLRPAATIDVRTVDAAGVPVPNVAFTYEFFGYAGSGMNVTFADGRQWFPVPPNVVMVVRVGSNRSHHAETSAAVWTGPLGAPPVTVTLRVEPAGHLTGVVRDPDGNPAATARVQAMPSAARGEAVQRFAFDRKDGGVEDVTDEQGRYEIEGLVRGRSYDVVASDPTAWAPSVPERVVATIVAPDVARDLALRRNAKLIVRVTGPNGALVPDASIMLMRRGGFQAVTPQSPGVFEWPSFAPGESSFMATAPRLAPCYRVVEIPAGESVEMTLQLGERMPEISGVVVDETGLGVPGAKVGVRMNSRADVHTVANATTSDDIGRFRGAVLGSGPCLLQVEAPGHLPVRDLAVPDPSQEIRIVMRRAATLEFHVVADEATRIGTIRLLFGGRGHVETVYTDSLGAARVEVEPLGETEMRLFVEGSAPVIRRVTLAAGAVEDIGEIRLAQPAPLLGRVVDLAGRPVAKATVRLDMGDDDLKLETVATNADGEFNAALAPATGLVALRADADGFLPTRATVAVGNGSPITLRLAHGGVVWGEVVDATGAPAPIATVSLADAQARTTSTVADESGIFGLRVAAGRYSVCVGGVTETVDVAEGGESHVRVVGRSP